MTKKTKRPKMGRPRVLEGDGKRIQVWIDPRMLQRLNDTRQPGESLSAVARRLLDQALGDR